MLSLLSLLSRLLVVTRRSIAGWVAYAAGLAILYAAPSPLDELYVATAVLLVPVTTWLVVSGFVLDRSTTSFLAAAAGGSARLHALQTVAGLLAALPLGLVAVVGDRLLAGALEDRAVVLPGACAHLAAVLVGAGIGAVAARPVVHDAALSLVVAVGGFVAVTVVPGVSPLAPALDAVVEATGPRAAICCIAAAVWAAALTCLGGAVAARRRSYGAAAPP